MTAAGPRNTDVVAVAAAVARARAEREEGLALLRETESVRRELADATAAAAENARVSAERKFKVGITVAAANWTNAGSTTVEATLETVLWAGAGGDVQTLAQTFSLMDPRAAQKAWANAPESLRRQYATAEQLIAFLAIRDVPAGSAQIRRINPLEDWPNPAAQVTLLVKDEQEKGRDIDLIFTNTGDGWKLVVWPDVVTNYAAMLAADGGTAP